MSDGEILLPAPSSVSVIIVPCAVGRFSYSPQAKHILSSFGAQWKDSLTRPRLDISPHGLTRGGEILVLAPGSTFLILVRPAVGRFSYSPQAGHLSSLFGVRWRDFLTHPRLNISYRLSARGGEILLLAPGLTFLLMVWREVGRFSYSPQARHFSSSFGLRWGDSLTPVSYTHLTLPTTAEV